MDMQEIEHNGAVPNSAQRCCKIGGEVREHSEDFMMPDYIPDIRRVAYCDVRAEVQKLSAENGRITWECMLTYTALLLGDDDTLRNVILQSRVEGDLKAEGALDSTWLEVKLENAGMRALDPRRMNGRSRICVYAYAPCRVTTDPEIKGDESSAVYIEKKTKRVHYTTLVKAEQNDQRVSEDIELGSSMPEISDIIYCDVIPYLTACTVKDGHAELRGEAAMELLYADANGEYFPHSARVPLSASFAVPYEDIRGAFARARIGEVKAAAQTNSYGENKIIELDFSWDADINCALDDECEITSDLYSTAHEITIGKKDIVLDSYVGSFCGNLSIGGENSFEDLSISNVEGITAARASAHISDVVRNENGRTVINGGVDVSIVCCVGGEKQGHSACEIKLPFKYERDLDPEGNDFDCRCSVNVSSVKARVDHSKIRVDCELVISGIMTAPFAEKGISEVEIKEPLSFERAPMTLCFNSSGDGLWEIAKRYKVTPAEILERNGIDEDQLPSKRVLVIPAARKAAGFSRVI